MEAVKVTICEHQQMVKCQSLGELAELVALRGTDEPVKALPNISLVGLVLNLLKQRLLGLTQCLIPHQKAALMTQALVDRSA